MASYSVQHMIWPALAACAQLFACGSQVTVDHSIQGAGGGGGGLDATTTISSSVSSSTTVTSSATGGPHCGSGGGGEIAQVCATLCDNITTHEGCGFPPCEECLGPCNEYFVAANEAGCLPEAFAWVACVQASWPSDCCCTDLDTQCIEEQAACQACKSSNNVCEW